jgi:hypothetical protein
MPEKPFLSDSFIDFTVAGEVVNDLISMKRLSSRFHHYLSHCILAAWCHRSSWRRLGWPLCWTLEFLPSDLSHLRARSLICDARKGRRLRLT